MHPSQLRKLRQGLSCEGIGPSLSPEAGHLDTYFSTQTPTVWEIGSFLWRACFLGC